MAAESGELPQALKDEPAIAPHLIVVWRAFLALRGDRQIGFGGVGAIPFLAIDRYAQRYGITGADQFDRFLTLIMAMDDAYREHANKKT